MTHDDPDYPLLQRMIDYATPWGLDHPDSLYLYAPLRGGASYTLFGNRGTANVFDVQVNAGHFSAGRVDAVTTLASLDDGTLTVDADGQAAIHIGPEPGGSNGLRAGPRARFLLVRQYFADWVAERPATLQIERDDAIWPIPPPRPALIGRQLDTLTDWLERAGAQWAAMSEHWLNMPDNSIIVHQPNEDAQGALAGQVYAMGNFHCGVDETVVIRLTIPSCAHWNVCLANRFWESIEYASRQSSLNHHQAAQHADGTVTCVIAHRDPGLVNWLDPSGHERGTLCVRMHKATATPTIELTRQPLDRLADALPPGCPRITASTRHMQLTERRRAVIRRFGA